MDPFDPFGDNSGRAGAKTPVDVSVSSIIIYPYSKCVLMNFRALLDV